MTMNVDELTPKILTEEWLKRLDIGGCNPKNPSKSKRIIAFAYIIYNSIMITLMLINSIMSEFNTIGHIAENLIISLGFFQEVVKIITCLMKAKLLSEMIDIIWYKFWKTDKFTLAIQKRVLNINKTLRIIASGYGYNVVGATVFYVIGAMLFGDKSLPMDIWIPNKHILKSSPYYEIVSLIEITFTLTSAIFCLIPFDALFIITIGLVYSQFILLNESIDNVGDNLEENTVYDLIKKCIAHHNLLLRFLQMIESVYSYALLLTIGSNLLLTTLTMYGIVMESETSRKITFSFVFTGVFMQLFFYCQTGQLIQDKVESIGEVAYNCNWVDVSDKNFKMALKLMIQRSQRRFNITMGGFMVLNLETFATVVRASFSFLTFLENVKSA